MTSPDYQRDADPISVHAMIRAQERWGFVPTPEEVGTMFLDIVEGRSVYGGVNLSPGKNHARELHKVKVRGVLYPVLYAPGTPIIVTVLWPLQGSPKGEWSLLPEDSLRHRLPFLPEMTLDALTDKPLAAAPLGSYRYPNPYGGWIMLGAETAAQAVREVQRSLSYGKADPLLVEKWNGLGYVAAFPESGDG